jgi:hypothetical protein
MAIKKLSRLSSDDEQRRVINALTQKVAELEAVQAMLLSLLVELGAIDEDELYAKVNQTLAPVRRGAFGTVGPPPVVREAVPMEGRGGPYRAPMTEFIPKVVVCDSCGETIAAEQSLYDDFGGCVCEDCFNAARLGR